MTRRSALVQGKRFKAQDVEQHNQRHTVDESGFMVVWLFSCPRLTGAIDYACRLRGY